MRLIVVTPLAILVDTNNVVHLRAEDETGAFGILFGHADFLTMLSVSVVSWRDQDRAEHYLAVRGGMLEVSAGKIISIATREAVAGDDLQRLETDVLARFQHGIEEERVARTDSKRLYIAAIRQIYRFLKSEGTPAVHGGPGPGITQRDGF